MKLATKREVSYMSANPHVSRRAFRIEGHVQGVGFRWWTQAVARELGIYGWVRNRSDGSVEVHAGGAAGAMTVFEERLCSGPSSGRVDRVTPLELAAAVSPLDFEIR